MIERFPDLLQKFQAVYEESNLVQVAKVLRPLTLGLILDFFHSRTNALLYEYSSPMDMYKHLASLRSRDDENSENRVRNP